MCHDHDVPGAPRGREVEVATRFGGSVTTRVFAPEQGGPAVVIVPDYFGPSPFYDHLGALLCEAGFTAVETDPYFRHGHVEFGDAAAAGARLSRLGDDEASSDLQDVRAAAADIAGSATAGVIGFCAGGTWAMCLAEEADTPAVSFYGFPQGLPGEVERLAPIDRVDRLRSPLLAFWGDQDQAVGAEAMDRYVAATDDVATNVRYPDVGHGFLRGLVEPASAEAASADDAWKRTVEFLGRHVAPG
jgi:carboxymethylenebutenolidase